MNRAAIAWGSTLVLAAAGSQVAHAFAYRLVTPHEHERARVSADTGHGYMGYWPVMLTAGAILLVAVLVSEVRAAGRRYGTRVHFGRFAFVALAFCVAQEHLERFVHDGALPWTVALQLPFIVDWSLQLPFALAAYLVARLLLSVARDHRASPG